MFEYLLTKNDLPDIHIHYFLGWHAAL